MYKIEFNLVFNKTITKELLKKISEISDSLKDKVEKSGSTFKYELKENGTDSILFKVDSNALTVTDFAVQFEKKIKEEIGKQFKLGIKEFNILNYEITEELEETPKKEFIVPLAKKISFYGKKVTIIYNNIPFDWIKNHYIEKTLKLIKDKIKILNYDGKDEFKEYVWEGKERKIEHYADPAILLEQKGWIKRTDSKGQYIYGREFTALLNVLKELYVEKIYTKLGFYEMIFPKFEPWSVPMKSGHAKNIYSNAYFVSVPKKSSPEYWQEIMDLFAITGEVQTELIKDKVDCVGIMSYAQCPPFWPFLHNRIIDEKTLPLLIFDWSGPTYRNESGGTHGLDRVEEFNRIETLFVGTKPQVIDAWKKLKEAFTEFYNKVLDIEVKVARVTPWWMAHAGIKTETGNEEMGTFDFDAYLPYRGDRTKEWLEIQNVSSNGDKYPIAFNVKGMDQQFLWSGCAGASFQRVIVAFLAQKGLDSKNWPKDVKERYEKNVKGITELKFC